MSEQMKNMPLTGEKAGSCAGGIVRVCQEMTKNGGSHCAVK